MPAAAECLGDATIAAYIDGALDHAEIGRVDRHIDTCAACREQLSAVATSPVMHSFVSDVATGDAPTEVAPGSVTPPGARGDGPEPGTALGRYLVEAVIGRGGMGVVVRAHDPELDRAVAIKLVDPALGGDATHRRVGGGWRARLRAEARAMARLRHPNVVAVHDVGTVGDQLFVAMELVTGASLGRWRVGRRRGELLAAVLAAGRGLAAAHAAGLVHGDVKPDNILVDRDGRALIGDFGLAHAIADASGVEPADGVRRVGGTPPYMAPELFRAAPADPRSDQFAFAVTLYEVLVGERPWRGSTITELQAAIDRGPPPRPAKLPGWLWATIARGLATDPAARHPSVAAMLDTLARGAARRRRTALGAGAAVLAAGAGVAIVVATRSPPASCADPVGRVAELARAGAALCGADGGPAGCAAITAGLDRRLAAWRTTHVAVCRATRDGRQSPDLLDARMRCLDRRLVEHDALIERLGAPPLTSALASGALVALDGLAAPETCATADRAGGAAPPAGKARAIAAAERWVAAAEADFALGRYRDGLAAFAPHIVAIRALGHPPLDASADTVLGQYQRQTGALDDAEATFEHGLRAAAEARDDVATAKLMLDLAYLVGEARQDPARGSELLRAASVAIVRAGNPPELESIYLIDRAGFAEQTGDIAAAVADYTRAVELRRAALGRDASDTAIALGRLCGAEGEVGKLDDARRHCQESAEILRRALGPDHPLAAEAGNGIAVTFAMQGDLDTARQHWERALASLERSLGSDAAGLGPILLNLSQVSGMLGDADAAKRYLDRAVAIAGTRPDDVDDLPLRIRVAVQLAATGDLATAIATLVDVVARGSARLGDAHPTVADALSKLAGVYYNAGRLGDARATFERAIEASRKIYGERHPTTLTTEGQYGQTLVELHDPAAARPVLERVMLALEATVAADSPFLAQAYQNLAACLLDLDQPDRAVELATKSVAIWDARGGDDPVQPPEARFILARALWRARADRGRAVTLARAARDQMRAAGNPDSSLADVERWLARPR